MSKISDALFVGGLKMFKKLWVAVLAILSALAVALKISHNKNEKLKEENAATKNQVAQVKKQAEVEREMQTEQQEIQDAEPKNTVRTDRPTGSFGDRRLFDKN